MSPIVSIRGLQVVLAGRSILSGLDVTLHAGEVLNVVGPNGAGKSTLLKALTGLVAATQGTVEILGQRVHPGLGRKRLRALRSRVGQVFQGLHLVPRLTALENVLIGRLAHNHSLLTLARIFSAEDHRMAREAMEKVGILDRAETRVDKLSGGERQKVAMARVLAQEARLLLADEPTANLDPRAATECADLLRRLAVEQQLAVISVVHSLALLPHLGGQVLGIRDGKAQFLLPVSQVTEAQLSSLYEGVPKQGAVTAEAKESLHEAGSNHLAG